MGLLKRILDDQSITVIPNVFKPVSSRIVKTGHWNTIGEAYAETKCPIPFEAFSWVVNGTGVTLPDYPLENGAVINGYILYGESTQDYGAATKIGGWVMVVAGVIVGVATSWTGLGAAAATGLIGSGISMLLGGTILLFGSEVADLSTDNSGKKHPSLRGGNNRFNVGGGTPIILGRHRISPDYAAEYYDLIPDPTATEVYGGRVKAQVWVEPTSQYESGHYDYVYTDSYVTDIDTDVALSKKQIFYALFCPGQKSLTIDTSSFRVGDTYLTSYSDYETEVIQDGTVSDLVPRAVNVISVGEELKYTASITAENGGAIATLPKGITDIEADLIYSGGLYRIDSDGDDAARTSKIDIYWREVGGASWIFLKNITFAAQDRSGFRCRFQKSSLDKTKQYEFHFRRGTLESGSNSKVDKVYLGAVRCFRDVTDVITAEYRNALSFVALKIRSSDQLTGAIDTFNLIAQTHIRDYDGSGTGAAQWPVGDTSNPASLALYLITSPEIVKADYAADAEIDWASFEEWHNFCVTKSYECNLAITEDKTISEILDIVATCGRAQIVKKEGKYSVIIDQARTAPVQMFTERNSANWKTTKSYPVIPDAVRINFIDASVDFQETQAVIPKDATIFPTLLNPSYQTADYAGVTNYNQLWSLTRYKIACGILRAELHSFDTDIEHIRCTRGDWVRVQAPTILWGIGPGARVRTVVMTGPNVTSITTDEYFFMEAAKSYAVGYRKSDGTLAEHNIDSPVSDESTNEFTFTTPFSTNLPVIGDLLAFGEEDYVTSDIIVQEISWQQDGGASIRGVAYAPDVFTADSGTIPDFDPKISIPGENNTGSFLGIIPEDENAELEALNAIAAHEAITDRAVVASYPDLYKATTVPAIWFAEKTDGFTFFVSMADGLLRQKAISRVGAGTPVTTAISGPITLNGDNGLIYVNQTQGSKLYWIEPTDTDDGTALTTATAWCPTADNDRCFYINADDGNTIYETAVTTTADNGSQVATFPVSWIEYCAATNELFYLTPAGAIYRKSADDGTAGTAVYTVAVGASNFSVSCSGSYIVYIRSDNLGVYKKSITTDAAVDGTPIYVLATFCYVSPEENIYLTSGHDSGYLYIALKDRAVEAPTLAAEETGYVIQGTIANGNTMVTGVDAEDLDVIEVNDALEGTGIPAGAFIQVKGPTYFIMSVAATSSGAVDITVSGTRIFLDANRVVVPGTIQARLLSASAINSKARTDGGFYKSDFDLDEGTIKLRADDDTVVLDFDPDRTGEELQLTGTIQSGNYVAGSAGWAIDNDGDAEFETVVIRNITGGPLVIDDTAKTLTFDGNTQVLQECFIRGGIMGTPLAIAGLWYLRIVEMAPGVIVMLNPTVSDCVIQAYRWNGATGAAAAFTAYGSAYTISGAGSGYNGLARLSNSKIAVFDYVAETLSSYNFDGSTWTASGTPLSITGGSSGGLLTGIENLRVAFSPINGNILETYRWTGSTFEKVGNTLSPVPTGYISSMCNIYNKAIQTIAVTTDEGVSRYSFDGTDWALIGAGYSIALGTNSGITSPNSTDVLVVSDNISDIVRLRFVGGIWYVVSTTLTGYVSLNNPDIVALDDRYVAVAADSTNELALFRPENLFTVAVWETD